MKHLTFSFKMENVTDYKVMVILIKLFTSLSNSTTRLINGLIVIKLIDSKQEVENFEGMLAAMNTCKGTLSKVGSVRFASYQVS